MRDFLRQADEAREKRAFIAGYVTALQDVERTGLRPMADDVIKRAAERAWVLRGG